MTGRVAIVGANGRIGGELALRLSGRENLDVVGICRNPSGSAFLRLCGVTCRHADVADPAQAKAALADCDVVFQLAYRAPRSRSEALANRAVVRNCVVSAPAGAHVITASTIMVYAPEIALRVPDAYGWEKLSLERVARRGAIGTSRLLTILRIGHALGPLQPQSVEIMTALRHGSVMLPDCGARPSNTVFVATLADAVARAAVGALSTGTFDAVTSPQWTWANVFRHHAEEGHYVSQLVGGDTSSSLRDLVRSRARIILALAPDALAERAYGLHLRRRASYQPTTRARRIEDRPHVTPATGWRAVGSQALPGILDPREALLRYPLSDLSWADIVPRAGWSLRTHGSRGDGERE
ncbi:MAG: NAD(P)-dependent oxidoreductase [Actinomycetota bacterium]